MRITNRSNLPWMQKIEGFARLIRGLLSTLEGANCHGCRKGFTWGYGNYRSMMNEATILQTGSSVQWSCRMNHFWEQRLSESLMGAICRGCQGFAQGIRRLFSFAWGCNLPQMPNGFARCYEGSALQSQNSGSKGFVFMVRHIVTCSELCTLEITGFFSLSQTHCRMQ